MADRDDDKTQEPRLPTLDDLLLLCRRLNDAGAKYIVIGGWAVIQHGFGRTTTDIDLLVDASRENFEKIKTAMAGLPDGAIREVQPDDLEQFVVVRVGDEFVVDLMKAACGVEYAEAVQDVSQVDVQGVMIPFANPKLLWRLKQTYREKDAWDRAFLKKLLNDRAG
ncbi:MAG: hypothetical protein AAB676_20745 [Verrucomicrobiota bacterium]